MAAESSKQTKSKAKSTAKPKRASRSRKKAETNDDTPDFIAEAMDFGKGDEDVSFDEPAEKPKPKRTTRTRKPKVEKAADTGGDDAIAVDEEAAPSTRRKTASRKKPATEEVEKSDSETTVNDPVASSDESAGGDSGRSSSDDNSKNNNGGGDRPQRRRRRRRGKGGGQDNNGPQQGRNRQGGGNRDRNNNDRNGGGRNRNRRNSNRNPQTKSRDIPDISGTIEGVLELHPKGYGFLRDGKNDYGSLDTDAFVSSTMVEKHNLREGILIRGEVGPGTRGQGPRLLSIESIDKRTIEEYEKIKSFEDLTAINPFEQIRLETGAQPVTMRVMDLLTPIGKGQRALIVAPPRTGKTMLLQDIANSVSTNHPEVHLIVLLIDERPEEVTEMRRLVNGDVIASSMDRDVESHVRTSQLIIERGKRIAESGGHAFILLDSITRTARAFNKWVGNTGRTMTGGLDVKAMDIPKKMFGTARRFDEGGSLTVVGTALIDTGSRMDEVIFQEFKGTGNMEMVLSRDLADRRIWPSIDISKSGTRREEKILEPEVMEGVTALRRALISMGPVEAMEELTRRLAMFPTNSEFLSKIRSIL